MTKNSILRPLSLLIAVILTFTLVACGGGNSSSSSSQGSSSGTTQTPSASSGTATPDAGAEPVKVAVFIALSGTDASSAVFQIQALDLVVAEINAKGGVEGLDGAPIELVYFDNMSDTTQMKTVVEAALQDDDITFALFPASSAYTFAAIAAITKSQTPSLTTSRSDSIFQQGCDYIYTVGQLSSLGAGLAMDYCQWLAKEYDLDTTKIGIISVDNEYGVTNARGYRDNIAKIDGFEIVYDSLYPVAISDMSSIVTALKTNGVEILFQTGLDQDSKLLFNTISMMNFNPVVIGGGSGLLYPSYANALGDDVIGLISSSMGCSNFKAAVEDPTYSALMNKCYDLYGHEGGDYMLCYDAMFKIIVDTLNETGTRDREINNKALKNMEYEVLYPMLDKEGNPTNIMYFDEFGTSPNSILTMVQYRKTNHGNVPVVIYPKAFATAELQFGTGVK